MLRCSRFAVTDVFIASAFWVVLIAMFQSQGMPDFVRDDILLLPLRRWGLPARISIREYSRVSFISLHADERTKVGSIVEKALAVAGPALIEAPIDPNEPLLPPKHFPKYVENLHKALEEDTPGREDIEHALAKEPARTLWQGMQH